jgi:hypothetical protein
LQNENFESMLTRRRGDWDSVTYSYKSQNGTIHASICSSSPLTNNELPMTLGHLETRKYRLVWLRIKHSEEHGYCWNFKGPLFDAHYVIDDSYIERVIELLNSDEKRGKLGDLEDLIKHFIFKGYIEEIVASLSNKKVYKHLGVVIERSNV